MRGDVWHIIMEQVAHCFNPRPYMRGDVELVAIGDVKLEVSIHAPI